GGSGVDESSGPPAADPREQGAARRSARHLGLEAHSQRSDRRPEGPAREPQGGDPGVPALDARARPRGVQGNRRVARRLREGRRLEVSGDPRAQRDREGAQRQVVTQEMTRREWMSVLALATTEELETAWRRVSSPPPHRLVRGPEIGLAMVRA